ncbi:hypothetical protein ACP_0757 [Acidobacterium capsulatum ATCC 51196]|uniref:Uncharacterized protein n=1 Tax=Acidobacterium capsulatum (strain ATCC 51196 / DSM 11244 / BCRC 80197 / JCM 7670 / NBRC 15755 / NCIMB 13165 / 161) TaxID=240015 RepID=C1F296_ACIC5|nr:hypothetical protein ACP_0757 [Acidobacterium capsulatum ATCC 51196]
MIENLSASEEIPTDFRQLAPGKNVPLSSTLEMRKSDHQRQHR